MDEGNFQSLIGVKPNASQVRKIRFLRDFDPFPGEINVPDPYYGTEQEFENVFTILDGCVEQLLKREFNL
jgi:protein-tyrosine phosphatase